ncbi:MAG: YqaA family protein [Flavobacteriia bacterium]|jgi:membrane protein YqaA with SNARE-associated domain
MDFISIGYGGLFLAGFLSATILPMNSEAVILLMLSQDFDPWTCILIATIGNSLGGLTNYFLGLLGNPKWLKRVGISEEKIQSFEGRVQKYGYWLAFFSWMPFIGDPMTVALGFFRASFWRVAFLVILGKFLRYLVLAFPFM